MLLVYKIQGWMYLFSDTDIAFVLSVKLLIPTYSSFAPVSVRVWTRASSEDVGWRQSEEERGNEHLAPFACHCSWLSLNRCS